MQLSAAVISVILADGYSAAATDSRDAAIADEIMASMRSFEDLFQYGTPEEKKEFIRLWLDDIDFDPKGPRVRVYMRRFPAPSQVTGNSSLRLVARARYTHKKKNFPPVDVIDIQFEYQGKALVPIGA